MTSSMSERSRACVRKLREVISALANPRSADEHVKQVQVNEELDRFILFVGNIGGFHEPESPLSVDSRLREAKDVLDHILGLLDDLVEAAEELRQIVCGERQGMTCGPGENEDGKDLGTSEEYELRDEISATITRLFRVTALVRQAAPTDPFAKALSRNRYRFNDQFDIAHVGQRYPSLATDDYIWLRQRLGKAITHRRHYLTYMRDHRDKLEGESYQDDETRDDTGRSHVPITGQLQGLDLKQDTMSRPSYYTKATTIVPERLALSSLDAEEPDSEDDTRSYTTISRSVDENDETSTTFRIPRLEDLRSASGKEIECPFCFRIKRFKNERVWRKHVFSDIRPYVCTFPDCDAPYFGDINKWFQHEMTYHRVAYRCFLCPDAFYRREKAYVAHLKRMHSDTLNQAESEQNITLAREPLSQIPAMDCPCCTDWVDRLREHSGLTVGLSPSEVLTVDPTAFKRHLAKHLEHLALFAIPISAAADDPDNSTDVNEADDTYMEFSESYDHEVYAPTTQSTQVVLPAMKTSQAESSPKSISRATPLSAEAMNQNTSHTHSPPNWIWDERYQDYYCVTLDEHQHPVYHWAKQQAQADIIDLSRRQDSDGSKVAQMPDPAPQDVRAMKDFIGGTPQSGWYDNLDSSYCIRTAAEAYDFFVVGKVFVMLYSEAASETSQATLYDDAYTLVRFGERVYTNIRRFVVLEVGNGFVKACGIGTYSNRKTHKDNYRLSEHAVVYLQGTNPASCYLEGEKDSGMTKDAIEIIPVDSSIRLRSNSRIRFGKTYPIEKNVKVKEFGQVHPEHIGRLLQYWKDEDS